MTNSKTADGIRRREMLLAVAAGGAALGLAPSALAQVGEAAPDAPRTAPTTVQATRSEASGTNGVVTAGHPLAAGAGLRMLIAGGSAADAAVAAMAVLNVVEPWASGAGGNGFATVFTARDGRVRSLHFAGAAPALLDADAVAPRELDWGPKAAATPGAFGGWIELLRSLGRLSLRDVLAPAIGYARDGHVLDTSIASTIARMTTRLAEFATTRDIYLPGGSAPAPRTLFRNIPLSRTFETFVAAEQAALRSGGSREAGLQAAYDAFYKGPVAREADRYYRNAGGYLRAADFAAYRPVWRDTVSTRFNGAIVHSTPPTSRGGLEVCLQLNLIERLPIAGLSPVSAEHIHLMAEAIKAAKAEIYPYVADPAFAPTPVAGLLSKSFAADRAALIDPARAAAFGGPTDLRSYQPDAPPPPPAPQPAGDDGSRFSDTTSLSVVDQDGNVVAATTTLGGGFGAGAVAGSTGLIFNNGMRLGSTSPYRGTPNFVGAGKIPILNNAPVVVLKDGRFELALGSPGGETIGQTQFQVLVNVLVHGMGVQEAIEAPRFSVRGIPNFYLPGANVGLDLESRAPAEVAARLTEMGHVVRRVGPYAIGSIQAVRSVAPHAWVGGADPRRMAAAVGW